MPFPCAFLDECVIIKQNIRNRIGRWREAFGVFFQTHSKVVVPETFLLYRKFLKSSEIVYNRLEIKNDITKERRGLRHDVVYEVFCFGLG